VVVRARGAAAPGGTAPRDATPGKTGCMQNDLRKQTFVVVEGTTVVASFVSLRAALEFRAKSGSRFARILADHGEFDQIRFSGTQTNNVWVADR